MRRLAIPLWLLLGAAAAGAEGPAGRLAEEIVRSTGVKHGLCVHLGCTDGSLAVELARQGKFIVHGLAATAEAALEARRYVQSQGLHGTVSIEQGTLSRLPYVDNLVNLVVIDDPAAARRNGLSLEEVNRVLRPGGVAFLRGQEKIVKPRPEEMDEWTHWLHGPECNNHSSDSLAGPAAGGQVHRSLQWIDGPVWTTGSNITELFAGGRSFNIYRNMQGKGAQVIARDAFNGLTLWRREIGSADPRVMVAVGERLFTVLEEGGPLVALGAASGDVVSTYKVGVSPQVAFYQEGHLVLGSEREICSVDVETDKVRWRKGAPTDAAFVLQPDGSGPVVLYKPPYMVSGGGRLFVLVKDAPKPPYSLVSYDLVTGEEKWRKKQPGEILAYYKGVLLLYEVQSTSKPSRTYEAPETGVYHAVSADDGRNLWDRQHTRGPGHEIWDDPCYSGGFVWVRGQSIDPSTGKEGRSFKTALRGHCGPIITTERYMYGAMGDITSFETGKNACPGWYKNGCVVGQIPANGLSHIFPISCSCSAYFRGHVAFAPAPAGRQGEAVNAEAARLERGPAYGFQPRASAGAPGSEWPTYRHDALRSGSTPEVLPAELRALWGSAVTGQERAEHGKTLSPPVVAEGMVFVSAPDSQQVCALDAKTGEVRWRYLLGGRVEVPPTIFRGLCLFGANDGWVYCLRAADGELAWRFRAAPREERIVAYGRLESTWPVPGVLVENGVACFAAGRHSGSDDGVTVFAADPFTGKVLWEQRVDSQTVREVWYDNNANDLLVSNGAAIFMCQQKLDLKTGERKRTWYKGKGYSDHYLMSGQGRDTSAVIPFGFLYDRKDGAGLERYDCTHWYYRGVRGLVLSLTDKMAFGVVETGAPWKRSEWQLFARNLEGEGDLAKNSAAWSMAVPAESHALLPTGKILFLAGPGDKGDGKLWAFSANDGKKLSELLFDEAPVFDGMAASGGRLYVSTRGGRIFCFGGAVAR